MAKSKAEMNAYEAERQANIAKNRALLMELMAPVPKDFLTSPQKASKKVEKDSDDQGQVVQVHTERKRGKKRPLEVSNASDDEGKTSKASKVEDGEKRYSLRDRNSLREKKQEAGIKKQMKSTSVESDDEEETLNGQKRKQRALKKDVHRNPKVFGNVPNVEVGDWFEGRMAASQAAVHAPTVAGISGDTTLGVWSLSLAGGYEDDIDLGYSFTYTGSGGRDLKGTKSNPKNLRTAPQTKDQEFSGMNLALKVSSERGKPIRVLRGWKGNSPWAPEEGYRYDGLYVCKKAWMEVGKAGYKVCRYALIRLEGQPAIPIREGRKDEVKEMVGFIVAD